MSVINFDATHVPPSTGELEPIPGGWYDAAMDASEMKPTKDAATTGHAFLECRYNVISGQYAGRKLFARFNLRNSNPVAQEIAYKEFSAVCHASGVLQVQASEQLHGIPIKLKVKIEAATGQYGAKNDIVAYRPANFVPDAPAQAAPAGFPAAPAMAPAMAPAPAGWAPPVNQQPWSQPAPAQPQQPQQQPAQMPAQAPMQPPPWGAQPQAQQAPQQPAPQQQQPATPPAQQVPWAAGQNPQGAVPPWQRAPGT
jgi:hypothetical protein